MALSSHHCEFLSTWLQAQHLDPRSLATYRRALASHPARVLVLRSFLLEPRAGALARFLDGEALFPSDLRAPPGGR